MGQHGEFRFLMSEGRDTKHREPRCVGDTTPGRDLHVFGRCSRKISRKREREHVDHRLARTGIQREVQPDLRGWPMKLRPNDDQAAGRIERVVHTTMAVP